VLGVQQVPALQTSPPGQLALQSSVPPQLFERLPHWPGKAPQVTGVQHDPAVQTAPLAQLVLQFTAEPQLSGYEPHWPG
jgi:hypothetical protein